MAFQISFEELAPSTVRDLRIGIIPWDSETFGFQVADMKSSSSPAEPTEAHAIRSALEQWSRERDVQLVGITLPAEETGTIARLQQAGFMYIDTVLSLTYDNVKIEKLPRANLKLEVATEEDRPALETLAETIFGHGRYHADPAFPRNLANKRYRDWISRTFTPENTQQILINKTAEGIRGFSIVQLDEGATGYFHLMAVAERWHGTAVSVGLLSSTLKYFVDAGVKTIHSKISANNTKVLNLHAYHGARYRDCQILMHWHRPGSGCLT